VSERLDLAGLADRLAAGQGAARRIVAVAGAPGSGKSGFAERLQTRLAGRVAAQVLAQDGFHYDDLVLEARGQRARKGAPFTFDVDGLEATLARLAADRGDVAVPVFDRSIEIARAGARIIEAGTRLVIVEGNWLLLDEPGWAGLRRHFDLTVFLDVPEPELARRLRARWVGYGLDEAGIRSKLEDNDLPNARRAVEGSVPADVVVRNVG
jgi:pantothenate kinase